jgi:NCS1 family nucleobase:cation symporter-1
VYGELITDPIKTVERIDSTVAILLGAATFVTATVGINIVANFISPAFDFSHVSPQKISWRMGGMIAAVGSVLLTPWNWYNNDTAIHYSLGILGALIGPLFGILIADYYLIRRQQLVVDDLFTMDEDGAYHYRKGYNPVAIQSVIVAGLVAVASVLLPRWLGTALWISDYSWFIGCGVGFGLYTLLAKRAGVGVAVPKPLVEQVA